MLHNTYILKLIDWHIMSDVISIEYNCLRLCSVLFSINNATFHSTVLLTVNKLRSTSLGTMLTARLWDNNNSAFRFQHLHKPKESTPDVFRSSVEPMMHLFMTGFNCCLIVIGDEASGKAFTISDPGPGQSGVLPLLIQHLFAKLDEGMPPDLCSDWKVRWISHLFLFTSIFRVCTLWIANIFKLS